MRIPETNRKRRNKYESFMDELVTIAGTVPQDEAWLPWPGQKKLKPRTRNEYCNRLNNAEMFGPGFEGSVRNGWLYARYVG